MCHINDYCLFSYWTASLWTNWLFLKLLEYTKFCSAAYALLPTQNDIAGFNLMQKIKACYLLSSAAGNFFFLLQKAK